MSKKVAVMCGHGKSTDGSWDCGTSYGGYNEAALMLPITKAAVKYLRLYGVKVISDADTNNNKNMIADVKWANKEKCDLYVSIHCDYYKAPSGVMPLYVSSNGKKLATCLNNAVKKSMNLKSRGVVKRTDLYELNYTDCPACILETGSIKADIKILKTKANSYGKAIAKGICDYLGIEAKTKTPTQKIATKSTAKTIYRVRKSWNDVDSQVGAYTDLATAKKIADQKGLNVYGANGKLIYSGKKTTEKPKTETKTNTTKSTTTTTKSTTTKTTTNPVKVKEKTLVEKELEACRLQSVWMKNYKYSWPKWKPRNVAQSKKYGTCVTYVACVLQRLGYLKSGQYIWHNGKGYGTGKVVGTNSKMSVKYMKNKSFKALRDSLKAGDIILLDDNKSGVSGSGGHILILTGKWTKSGNPYVWDNETAKKGQKPRVYNGNRKVLARIRLKEI